MTQQNCHLFLIYTWVEIEMKFKYKILKLKNDLKNLKFYLNYY